MKASIPRVIVGHVLEVKPLVPGVSFLLEGFLVLMSHTYSSDDLLYFPT